MIFSLEPICESFQLDGRAKSEQHVTLNMDRASHFLWLSSRSCVSRICPGFSTMSQDFHFALLEQIIHLQTRYFSVQKLSVYPKTLLSMQSTPKAQSFLFFHTYLVNIELILKILDIKEVFYNFALHGGTGQLQYKAAQSVSFQQDALEVCFPFLSTHSLDP